MVKKQKKMSKKYMKALSNIFLRTLPTDPRCNMLQTLERQKIYWFHFVRRTHSVVVESIQIYCLYHFLIQKSNYFL